MRTAREGRGVSGVKMLSWEGGYIRFFFGGGGRGREGGEGGLVEVLDFEVGLIGVSLLKLRGMLT